MYKRRPLKVLSDAALTAENGSCNIDGDTCELPKTLPDYLNHFQNFTVDGVIIDDLGEAISRGEALRGAKRSAGSTIFTIVMNFREALSMNFERSRVKLRSGLL